MPSGWGEVNDTGAERLAAFGITDRERRVAAEDSGQHARDPRGPVLHHNDSGPEVVR